MKTLLLACGLIALAAWPARGGYLVEGASSSGARISTNYNTSSPLGPTYNLIAVGDLGVFKDVRGTGSFGDALLKFALGSAIPAGQSIVGATLTLNVASSLLGIGGQSPSLIGAGFAADTNPIALADFDHDSIALGSLPVLGDMGSNLSSLARPLTYDVTRCLQFFEASGSLAVGFQFDNPTDGLILISSANDPNVANQPFLAITYAATVPEPTSVGLVALGLALAVAAARRRPRGLA